MTPAWDFVGLLILLSALAEMIVACYFTIHDLFKKKIGVGLGIFWLLFSITVATILHRGEPDDPWLVARIFFLLLTSVYFIGIFHIQNDAQKKN